MSKGDNLRCLPPREDGRKAPARRAIGIKRRPAGSLKAVTAEAIADVGGVRPAMALLGLSETRVYALADMGEPDEVTPARMEALSAAGSAAFANHFALLAGGIYVPLPRGADPAGLHLLTAEATADFGVFAATIVMALADGRVTRAEAREAIPRLDEALTALTRLRSELVDIEGREV
ncbi:phage regulatory CII family protein [Zavarzinia sp.]|uniref:phage regulatory CII family protein n=1 Tax=Zavarzinia sp. TaxID=2027920 RepID=UPI003BB7D5DF